MINRKEHFNPLNYCVKFNVDIVNPVNRIILECDCNMS